MPIHKISISTLYVSIIPCHFTFCNYILHLILFSMPTDNSHKSWAAPSDITSVSSVSKFDFLMSSLLIPGQCNLNCSREERMKASTRDFSWGKGGRCVWLTTYHHCSAETSRKSGVLIYPEPLGPPRPVAGDLYFTLLVALLGCCCTPVQSRCQLVQQHKLHKLHKLYKYRLPGRLIFLGGA